jgi:nitroreductase
MLESLTNTLSVADAATTRRSIRQYAPEPIPRDDLQAILETVALAPSAFNAQPWRFVVVEDADLKSRLAAVAFNQRQIHSAPTVLVLYSDMDDLMRTVPEVVHPGLPVDERTKTEQSVLGILGKMDERTRGDWGAAQAHIALGYLLLAASGLGYQTSTMGGFNAGGVKELLGLPESVRINALVAIGSGTEEGFPHHRHAVSRFTTFR